MQRHWELGSQKIIPRGGDKELGEINQAVASVVRHSTSNERACTWMEKEKRRGERREKRKRRQAGGSRDRKATEHLETTRGESGTAPGKNRRQGEGDAGFRRSGKSVHRHPCMRPPGRSASFLCRAVAFGEFSRLTTRTSNTLRVYELSSVICPSHRGAHISKRYCLHFNAPLLIPHAGGCLLFWELRTFQIISSLLLTTHLATINKNDCKVFCSYKY